MVKMPRNQIFYNNHMFGGAHIFVSKEFSRYYFIQIVILNFLGFISQQNIWMLLFYIITKTADSYPNKNSASHHVKTKIDVALNQLNLNIILLMFHYQVKVCIWWFAKGSILES